MILGANKIFDLCIYILSFWSKFIASSKFIALVPLGFRNHCNCAPWLSRSLPLFPVGFQGHCTCAHQLPRSTQMCPLASKFITFVQIDINAPYSVGRRLFPKFNMAENSPPKQFFYVSNMQKKLIDLNKIKINPLRARPLFSHSKYIAKFCFFRFLFLRNEIYDQKI